MIGRRMSNSSNKSVPLNHQRSYPMGNPNVGIPLNPMRSIPMGYPNTGMPMTNMINMNKRKRIGYGTRFSV